MNQAIKLNPFDSPKYVYMNVGLFREGPHFCGKTVVRHPEVILEDRIVLYPYRALSVEWKDVDRDSDPIWSQGFWSHYTTGGFISGGVDARPRFLDKIEESIQLYDEKGVVGLHDDQVVMLEAWLEAELNKQGSSLRNTSRFESGSIGLSGE